MDVSPRQMVSVATAMIPFLEHDDANRALMGANMQRQAVPLVKAEAPLVGTGMEYRAAVDAGDVVVAEAGGVVEDLCADYVTVHQDDGHRRTYLLHKFRRSNAGSCVNQKPVVFEGDRVEAGQVIADGPCTDEGEMALGRNLLVAFMPWEGHNYEDAIILSPAPRAGRRPHLDPHRGARGRRPRHQARARRRSPATSRTSPRRCSPTSTSAASSASAPRSSPATSWSARSRPRARPS